MSNSSKLIGTILALALCLPLHAGKIYKWQDENGSWHYSEKPPLEVTPETIKLKTEKADSEEAESTEELNQEEAPSSTGEEQAEKTPLPKSPEVLAAEQARKAENCEKAKKNLDTLTHRSKVLIDDEERGEQRYLDEEEHESWKEKSRAQVEEFCN